MNGEFIEVPLTQL